MIKEEVSFLLSKAHIIVGVTFFLALVAFFYATNLKIDPSFSSLISDETEYNTNERILANVQGNADIFVVIFELDESSSLQNRPRTLDTPEIRNHAALLRNTILESQYVSFVSPLEITDDGLYGRFIIQATTPRTVEGFAEVIDDIEYYFYQANVFPGISISLTGFPLLLNQVNNLIITDNIKTVLFTLVAIFLILYLYFHSVRLSLITLSVPVVSLAFLTGIMAYFNIAISITLAIVGILTVGLGVDFAIHLMVSYESYLEKNKSHKESIILAVDHLYIAILASFLTTAAGFSTLLFGISPATQSQGIVLSLAIVLIGLTTILYFPCAIYLFGDGHLPPKNKFFSTIKGYLGKLAVIQTKRPRTVLTVLGIATILMLFGASQVGFDTSNDNWIPEDDPVQESFRLNSFAFGNDFSSVRLVMSSHDFRNVHTVRDLQNLERKLLAIPNVEAIEGPFSDLPLDQAAITVALEEQSSRFNEDFTFTTLTLRASSFNSDSGGSSAVLDEIRDVINDNPVAFTEITLFGDVLRFRELGASLGRDTGVTTVFSFIFVFIIASLLYMSFSVGVIALLPIIVGIIWTVGFKGFFNVPFTSLSTGLIALVLGIGIDFAIHLVNSTKQNIHEEGMNLDDALIETMSYSGGALLLSSLTTFVGFISLVLAALLGIRRLGLSLAFSIASVFIITIIMVPSILSIRYKNAKKRKL
ncbi:MAG: efflux RND transporter permease subunit [Candidatus Woesearchaeota archaeon]